MRFRIFQRPSEAYYLYRFISFVQHKTPLFLDADWQMRFPDDWRAFPWTATKWNKLYAASGFRPLPTLQN